MTETDFAFLLELSRLGWHIAAVRWRMHFAVDEWVAW
jgi:hypothetical protein